MNINRNNYEAFFILYADRELSALQRTAVEDFLSLNPDLRPELDAILQTVLPAEALPSFSGKESLFRTTGEEIPVNLLNYESYFLRYTDDELTQEEKAATELFIYKNPEFQSEFELIQQCRLEPETSIRFPDKSILYRKEAEKRRPVFGLWPRLSAAAILLLVAGFIWWKNQQALSPASQPLAGQPVKPSPTVKKDNNPGKGTTSPSVKPAQKDEMPPATVAIVNAQPKTNAAVSKQAASLKAGKASGDPARSFTGPVLPPVKEDLAKIPSPLPTPAPDAGIDTNKPFDNAVAKGPGSELTTHPANEDYIYVDNTGDDQPKKRFRGLLRRTSRYVEQNSPVNSQRKRAGVFTASYEQ